MCGEGVEGGSERGVGGMRCGQWVLREVLLYDDNSDVC